MAVGVLAGGACGAAVSALCTVFAVHALGSFGIIVAIPLAAIIAYWFTEKPRRERQEWLRLEMKYFDVMTAMGLIVGVLATGLVLRHFHLLITPKWAINWP